MSYKSKVTGLIVGLVFAFILIFAIVGCLIASAVMNVNVICLFKHNYNDDGICTRCGKDNAVVEPDEPKQAIVTDENGNAMESDKVYAMPRGMVFSAPKRAASNVATQNDPTIVTIKATVTPNAAKYSHYDWSVDFVDEANVWAIGKNTSDYVTVNTLADDTLTATVTCKQAFGAQIKITVTCEVNGKSESCTVDYIKPLEGWELQFTNTTNPAANFTIANTTPRGTVNLPIWLNANSPTYSVKKTLTYGVGTVERETTFDFYCVYNAENFVIGSTIVFDAEFVSTMYSSVDDFYDDYGCWDMTQLQCRYNGSGHSSIDVNYNVANTPLAADSITLGDPIVF